MSVEREIFNTSKADYTNLKKYGFIRKDNLYIYTKFIMNNEFKICITVDSNSKVYGMIYDLQSKEAYTGFRIKSSNGKFVNKIRKVYSDILLDIRENCFKKKYFMSEQANRITSYIINKYDCKPEFLWEKYDNNGVFRNKINNKWFGIIMNINKAKLDGEEEIIDIIDVKANEKDIKELVCKDGYFEGYHMNKKNWLTITLNDTISDDEIIRHIDNSYNIVSKKK